jgi:CRISPR system Cascade subunit CasB
MTITPSASDVTERRRAFVHRLYGLYAALTAEAYRAGPARQQLAKLRRSFAGPRQEADAYAVVFPFEPPAREQKEWLLVAGLFAIHPHANTARGRTIGGAMRIVAASRGQSAERRLTQLLSVDQQALPHYLRQAVQLLRSEEVAFDVHRLLTDLIVLRRDDNEEAAQRVRLEWARHFHLPERPSRSPSVSDRTTVDQQPSDHQENQ